MTRSTISITTKDGMVITCASADDLGRVLVEIRRADDAMSVRPRKGWKEPPSASPAKEASWTTALVIKYRDALTDKSRDMLDAAAGLGDGAPVTDLITKLKTRGGAIGPMVSLCVRTAQRVAPELPAPIETIGRPGEKTLRFDSAFLAAALEVLAS